MGKQIDLNTVGLMRQRVYDRGVDPYGNLPRGACPSGCVQVFGIQHSREELSSTVNCVRLKVALCAKTPNKNVAISYPTPPFLIYDP